MVGRIMLWLFLERDKKYYVNLCIEVKRIFKYFNERGIVGDIVGGKEWIFNDFFWKEKG